MRTHTYRAISSGKFVGEVTDEFPVEAEETESAVDEWQTKHWSNLWAGQSKDHIDSVV